MTLIERLRRTCRKEYARQALANTGDGGGL